MEATQEEPAALPSRLDPLPVPVDLIRERLLEAVTVPADFLESLALQRAQNAAAHLTTQQQIDPARIQMADPETGKNEPEIGFSLGVPGS